MMSSHNHQFLKLFFHSIYDTRYKLHKILHGFLFCLLTLRRISTTVQLCGSVAQVLHFSDTNINGNPTLLGL